MGRPHGTAAAILLYNLKQGGRVVNLVGQKGQILTFFLFGGPDFKQVGCRI